jgi:hypothetical protein
MNNFAEMPLRASEMHNESTSVIRDRRHAMRASLRALCHSDHWLEACSSAGRINR